MASNTAEITINIVFGILATIIGIISIYEGRRLCIHRGWLCKSQNGLQSGKQIYHEHHIRWFAQDKTKMSRHSPRGIHSGLKTNIAEGGVNSEVGDIETGESNARAPEPLPAVREA